MIPNRIQCLFFKIVIYISFFTILNNTFSSRYGGYLSWNKVLILYDRRRMKKKTSFEKCWVVHACEAYNTVFFPLQLIKYVRKWYVLFVNLQGTFVHVWSCGLLVVNVFCGSQLQLLQKRMRFNKDMVKHFDGIWFLSNSLCVFYPCGKALG